MSRRSYNSLRHYDECIAQAIVQRYPIVGKPGFADRARAAQIMADRGMNDTEIADRIGCTDRSAFRLRRADIEPLPELAVAQ